MEKIITIAGFAMLCAFTSCKKDPVTGCFIKKGDTVTQEVEMAGNFTAIELYGLIDLEIIQNSQYKLEIEAGENTVAFYDVRVENGTLIIEDNSKCNAVRNFARPQVTVSLPELKQLRYYGNGTVTNSDTLITDHLEIDLWGGGEKVELTVKTDLLEGRIHASTCDLVLSGKTNHLGVFKRGLGKLKAFELQAQTCFVESFSVTDSEVKVNTLLDAKISYLGNIYYRGNPEIRFLETTGEGKLINAN